jgi:filamentous hemagglutinin
LSKTLKPNIYLVNDYITLTGKSITNNSGVILADGKTSLISSDDFINKNDGIIKGGDVQIASINGNVLNNNSNILAKENLIINSNKDIINENVSSIKGGSIQLVSINGSILNKIEVETKKLGKYLTYDKVSQGSSMEATSGNLVLQAKNNIENEAGIFKAKKDLYLTTQLGNVEFSAQEKKLNLNYEKGKNFVKIKDVQHLSSSASSENVVIKSGNDINLEAAKLNATNQINLNAANDVNVLAVNDIHYKDVQTSKKGTFSKSTTRNMTYNEDVVSSELNAKDIVINGTNDVTLQSAKLNSQDNLIANAENGNLNVVAKEYKEGELHSTSKSSFGGLSKSLNISSSDAIKLKSSDLITTNIDSNVLLTSGKDINVLASNISSAGNINLKAVDNVNISSQAQYDKNQEVHEKSSFNLAGLTALVGTNQSIYTQEVHNKDNANVTQISSNLNAGGNIVVNSGTTNIIGSNLEANNIAIKADTGSINVLNAQDMGNISSLDKKVDVKLNNVIKGSLNSIGGLSADNTKLKVNVASASYDEEKVKTDSNSTVASNLNARDGNVVLDSLSDINVTGSNLKAKDTIALNSSIGDINISNTTDTNNQTKDEKHAKAQLNLTVQNEYVETAQAVKAVAEATQQLKQTKDDYSNYKSEVKKLEVKLSQLESSYKNKEVGVDANDIEDLKDIIDNVKSQDKYYLAAISAASVNVASKSAAVVSQANAAARSSGTAGFSAGMSLDVNGSKTNTNTNSTTSNASNLNANNIFLQTNKELPNTSINVTGSNVIANENIDISTSNLNVIASQDTTSQTQDSKSLNGSIAYTMYGGGGGTAGLGYGTNNSQSDSLVNHNSILQANNMNIDVSNDANFIGATVRANDTLNLNVGNNLNLESVRDEYSSNNKGFNVNAGIGFGSAGANSNRSPSLDVGKQSSSNAGFSVNNGSTLNKQTVLSSITANNLNVAVIGNTNLKGSLIASGEFDNNGNFEDNKNLSFITNTLTFENMSNTNYSSNQSIGGNLNYNFESTKIVDNKSIPQQGGVSSVSYNASNGIDVNASKTLATLGQGNINIKDTANSDDLSRLNTDTSKINKDLYSSSTGTKVDAVLDTRLLSVDGINQIKDEAKTASTILTSINQIASTNRAGILDFFNETQKNVNVLDGIKSTIASNPQLAKQLSDPNVTPEQKQSMIGDIATSVAISLGYLAPNTKLVYTDETGASNEQIKGHYSTQTNTSYVNDKNNDSIVELVNTTAHETQHYMDAKSNVIVTDKTDNEKYVNNFANTVTDYTDYALSYTGNQSMATTNNHNNQTQNVTPVPSVFNTSSVLITNNKEFSAVDKSLGEDLTAKDGAEISKHVYKDDNKYTLPPHIQEITDESTLNKYGLSQKDLVNEKTGLKSALYLNENTGEVTYAYAGTDPKWNDIKTDILQGIGIPTDAYAQAINNAVKFNEATKELGVKASVTGHSLGGGEAAAASEKTGLEAKTYNAAGVHPFTVINEVGTKNIDNYYMQADPLTNAQLFIFQLPFAAGTQHELLPIQDASIIQNITIGHSIDTIRKNSNLKDK